MRARQGKLTIISRARSRSGGWGEQQMLAIARGLMCDPRLLLLDEPTEGLAPMIIDEIVDALKRIRDSSTSLSILIVDQNLEVCLKLASRHYVMEQGRIAYEGSSSDIAASPDIQQRFLGVDAVG
jgi:branched-chain amino acid transport system ATP-binding protein